jgi:uncharacterized protein (TIGR03435 family)
MGRCLPALPLLLLFASAVRCQPAGNLPSFQVVDIKPSDPAVTARSKGRVIPGGRIDMPGRTVNDCIMYAYGVQENMIFGGPKWASKDRYDIVAKAPANISPELMRPMFQALLADRLKLAIHQEEKVQSAYVLTIGKRSAKYQQGDGGRRECRWTNPETDIRRRECHNLSMAEFATELPGWAGVGLDLPVIDQTGLKGVYDFSFDLSRQNGKGVGKSATGTTPDSGPTIFSALDQIGLKLERRKVPVQVIVIDHVEHPE